MSFKSSYVFVCLCLIWHVIGLNGISLGLQMSEAVPTATAPNPNFNPAIGTLLETYRDRNGQPYGRYIVSEPVPIAEWEYKQVSEKLYVPVPVTESRTTTVPRYIPVVTQQLQLQNVPSFNPFSRPQQVWQYVPVTQYQIVYEQETKPFTFQKYEEKEVPKMVPVLATKTKQVSKIVDRALAPLPNANNVSPKSADPIETNLIQQNAQLAMASRNQPRFPTRPIGPAYGYNPGLNLLSQMPRPYYPNYGTTNSSTANSYGGNPMVAAAQQPNPNAANIHSNLVLPAVPLRPEPNNMVAYNAYGPYSNNPAYPPVYPNVNTSARPLFNWPTFATGTGSLFDRGLFSNNRSTNYIAANTPVTQPYAYNGSDQSGFGFRPVTSTYATPQSSWGIVPGNTYRDPMQGGMPATVLR